MFEQKPKPKQKPGQNKPTSPATPGLTTPKSVPLRPGEQRPSLRWLNRDGAQTPAGPATSAARKPSATPTLQHTVYRSPASPAQGTPAPKPPTSDPVRARIGAFGDKETRQALYSVYAAIRAAETVNPKQAQQALAIFQQQTLKDKAGKLLLQVGKSGSRQPRGAEVHSRELGSDSACSSRIR